MDSNRGGENTTENDYFQFKKISAFHSYLGSNWKSIRNGSLRALFRDSFTVCFWLDLDKKKYKYHEEEPNALKYQLKQRWNGRNALYCSAPELIGWMMPANCFEDPSSNSRTNVYSLKDFNRCIEKWNVSSVLSSLNCNLPLWFAHFSECFFNQLSPTTVYQLHIYAPQLSFELVCVVFNVSTFFSTFLFIIDWLSVLRVCIYSLILIHPNLVCCWFSFYQFFFISLQVFVVVCFE